MSEDDTLNRKELEVFSRQREDRGFSRSARAHVLLKGLEFKSGVVKTVLHGLDRQLEGWRAVRIVGALPGGYPVELKGKTTTRVMEMIHSGDATIDLEVW